MIHVELHPSCELILLSSHYYVPILYPSPHSVLQLPFNNIGNTQPSHVQERLQVVHVLLYKIYPEEHVLHILSLLHIVH
jgi:hypothetical protein